MLQEFPYADNYLPGIITPFTSWQVRQNGGVENIYNTVVFIRLTG
ncbi:hypothetical protein NSMM_160021 [Nitrosomonas mobilis]|uniref:Uncharacterized protein n=1 Tax=Nitrosomonas mobilis TaxID=51642 RepID=A0A1G5SD26_9PROT|nr:hypothetical protein NSMM_160021 [Nitrosomonas mobilis]